MEFILFNLNGSKKDKINKIEIENNIHINEISLSNERLKTRLDKSKKFSKIKDWAYDNNFKKIILKALKHSNQKWYYLLSKNLSDEHIKFLLDRCEENLGFKYNATSELNNNIFKYINDYSKEIKKRKHELKILVISEENKNVNISLMRKLIDEYKNVNLYLKQKPNEYITKQIKNINKAEGTTIEVIKKEKKAFNEYDVVYFVDGLKSNFPRLRFNKNALVVDISLEKEDKYNSNNIFIDEYIKGNNVIKDNIENLFSIYGKLEIGAIVHKLKNNY